MGDSRRHGGIGHGEEASEIVVDYLSQMPDDGDAGAHMESLLHAANADIQRRLTDLGQEAIGATVVALRLDAQSGHLAWAGDCRAYVVRDDAITQLSEDHTVVAELVRDGLLAPENAKGHTGSNVVTRAVGAEPQLVIDHRTISVEAGDHLVLCSDGLTACVEDKQILRRIQDSNDPDTACRYLVADCLKNGAPDNVSVIVIYAEES